MDKQPCQEIEKIQEKLEVLYRKREEINKKIKNAEQAVERMRHTEDSRKFNETEDVLSSKGLSLAEVLEAVANGNFLSLQEKIIKKGQDI